MSGTTLAAWLRARPRRDYFNAFICIAAAIPGVGYLILGEPSTGIYALVFAGAVAKNIHKDRQIRDLRARLKQTEETR